MDANGGVFVLTDKASLVPMQAAAFASENDFQELLAKFPALLAGDQINAADPRQFVLIDREYPIASGPGEAGRWSLDHLFLDQDGVPTLVEVKRGTDTRIRRELVGQMMDYAANAVSYWPAEMLRERFVERCKNSEREPCEALAEEFGGDVEWEAYWTAVKANLQSGRVRLLFVADRVPSELRKVVEFLNAQMRPAEVLAIELRQYAGGDLKTLAPIVLGQTQSALGEKAGASPKARRQWDEAQIVARLAEREGSQAAATAKAIMEWIRSHADRWTFNDAPSYGAMTAEIVVAAETVPLFKLWTDGNVQFLFNALARTKAYAEASRRGQLLQEIGNICGAAYKPEAVDRSPCVKASTLAGNRWAELGILFEDVVRRLREGG